MTPLITPEDLADRLRLPLDLDALPDLEQIAMAAEAVLLPWLTPEVDHGQHPACREAALGIAGYLWQARNAPGGAVVDLGDGGMAAAPSFTNQGLVRRVWGLISPCTDTGAVVVA